MRENFRTASRIVVKVGTSMLTYETGRLNLTRIDRLVRVLSDIANQGKEVILVTSGAIGVGVGLLNLHKKPETVREKQAIAAVGRCELMHIYGKFFLEYGRNVGQILLTRDAVEDDHRRQNVINTFETLLKMGIIPIVNENDSVAVEEIVFGDNDTLSAIVASLIKADLLIILSDIDGLYDKDPRKYSDAKLISEVSEITNDIVSNAGSEGTQRGTGGMITKISAAKIARESGVDMVIACGEEPLVVTDIIAGRKIGTLFHATLSKAKIQNSEVVKKCLKEE